MSRCVPSLAIAASLTLVSLGASRSHPAADCNAPTRDAIVHTPLGGSPFGVVTTADGCWVFVTLFRVAGREQGGALEVFRRERGTLERVITVPLAGAPGGLVLTHDESTLLVTVGDGVAFLDAKRLREARAGAVLGVLRDTLSRGRIYVNVTPDDRFAFVSDERSASISVIDLVAARRTHVDASATVGRIPVGAAPIALTFAPDGRRLYTTSQLAPPRLGWPRTCIPAGADPRPTQPTNPAGVVFVIDVAKATTDPANAVVSAVAAGCNPVRLVLSPAGDVAYVSARSDDALLAFDVARLVSDTAHARVASVPVGVAPVGVAVVDGGRKVLVTSSNRFSGGADDRQFVYVVDAQRTTAGAAVLGRIPAGAFPRELHVSRDGQTVFLTNFASSTLETIDVARLADVVERVP